MKKVGIDKIIKRIRKRQTDNRGLALVTVIVAIGFVAALVSILLMTTLVNFKMKVVNEKGNDTFYSAEQVMDEIAVGLQRIVSDAISQSYAEILEKYGDDTLDNDQKKLMVKTRYYERIWDELSYGTDHSQYDVEKLETFLKPSTIYHGNTWSDESGVSHTTDYGAVVVAANVVDDAGTVVEEKHGEMYTYSDTGIVLKNIKVYYRDINGFVSVIQSDIRLNYPEFDFARNSAMADIADYCFISDSGVQRTMAGTLDLEGNIYANNFYTKNVDVTFGDKSLILVKHDIDVEKASGYGGSLVTGDGGVIWADNLISKSANLEVKGAVNISNDLNLKGSGPSAKIKGEFNAYGSSIDYADDSSAILVNGKNTKIDFLGVTKMKISGRAFLGTSAAKTESFSKHNLDTATYNDIYTGESVAVKSDQLMYLVPPEAIGVDENTGRSLYNSNPLTKAQYEDIRNDKIVKNAENGTNYVMISDNVAISSLDGSTLAPYVKYNAAAKPEVYEHKIRVDDEATGYLVYFYMLFPDSNTANNYFKMYYAHNEVALAKYTKKYIQEAKFPNLVDGNSITAGSSYVTDAVNGGADGLVIMPENQLSANLYMAQDTADNLQKFKAYCTMLIPNYSELRGPILANDMDDRTSQVVFENTLKVTKIDSDGDGTLDTTIRGGEVLQDYIDRAVAAGSVGAGGIEMSITDGNKKMTFTDKSAGSSSSDWCVAIVATKDVEVNNPNIHLVITSGDVTVTTSSFTGVIICDGAVTFTGNASQTCKKDASLVKKCLSFGFEDTTNGYTYAVASCLKDGNDYVYSTVGRGTTTDTSLTGLVTYENWKKE